MPPDPGNPPNSASLTHSSCSESRIPQSRWGISHAGGDSSCHSPWQVLYFFHQEHNQTFSVFFQPASYPFPNPYSKIPDRRILLPDGSCFDGRLRRYPDPSLQLSDSAVFISATFFCCCHWTYRGPCRRPLSGLPPHRTVPDIP